MTLFSFVWECFQTEQLVDQQILISRLRSDLMTFRGNTSQAPVETGASGYSSKRPRSVPLIRDSSAHGPPRRVGSSYVLFCVCVCVRVYNWLCVYLLHQLHINHWLLLVLTFCLPLTLHALIHDRAYFCVNACVFVDPLQSPSLFTREGDSSL